jgi:hypothetical protein
MDPYTLFVYSDDGRLIGAGTVIHAANDAERGTLYAAARADAPFSAASLHQCFAIRRRNLRSLHRLCEHSHWRACSKHSAQWVTWCTSNWNAPVTVDSLQVGN